MSLPGQSIAGPHDKAELEHMTGPSRECGILSNEDKEPIINTSTA